MTGDISLESQNLIEPFCIITAVYQVPTDADDLPLPNIGST